MASEDGAQRALTDIKRVAEALEKADPLATARLRHRYDYRQMALAAIEALGLTEEVNTCVPISVPDFNEDGTPMMDDRMVILTHRHHFEWVTKRRLVSPWEEVGERETSQELDARLKQARAIDNSHDT